MPLSEQTRPAPVLPISRHFALPHAAGIVRAAREGDLHALEWHGGEDLRTFYREVWEQHEQADITMLIADFNDFPIGLAMIYWHGKSNHPHIPDLQSLRVMPVFRSMGIGSVLLEAVEATARAQGHEQISLSVGVDNPGARRLYERQEYSVVGGPNLFSWRYEDAAGHEVLVEENVLDMVKNLKGAS